VAGKFDGLANWHPDVQSVAAKGGDAAGAEREITLKKGGVLKEGLDEYDASAFKLSWRMSDPNLDALPVSSYTVTFDRTCVGGVVWYGMVTYRGDTSNEPPENLTMTPRARRWRVTCATVFRA
jgi:mxaD protein